MIQFNMPTPVEGCAEYIFKSDHRDGTRIKSQWTATPDEEIAIYKAYYVAEPQPFFFGIKSADDKCEQIGISAASVGEVRPLFVSKYIRNDQPHFCHGYPADPEIHHQDRPPMSLLQQWRASRLINKKEMNRFRGL